MKPRKWHREKVLQGTRYGRTIGFPTLNLSPRKFIGFRKEGVYSVIVKHQGMKYLVVLYFGPRLVKGEKHPVLEIHVLGFDKEIYGETIEFSLGNYIRGIMDFASMEKLKEQIEKDIKIAKQISSRKLSASKADSKMLTEI